MKRNTRQRVLTKQSFNKYLLSTYCATEIVPDSGNIATNPENRIPDYILWATADYNNN
jgi:hypothetical protein